MRLQARLRAAMCDTMRAASAPLLISIACAVACAACSERREEPADRAAPAAHPQASTGDAVQPSARAGDGASAAPTDSPSPASSSAAPAAPAPDASSAPAARPATAAAPLDPTIAPTARAATLYNRPIVIGASASDGFGISVRENGAKPGDGVSVSLADILRVALDDRRTVEGYASSMTFVNPGPILSGEMERALRHSPTIVVGIDFLFWYVYGTEDATGGLMRSREQRLENLERGLAQVDMALARGVPVIIGDIPDMKAAIGKMLSRAQVPDAATLDAVNARITEWAQSRPGARVFGLRESVMSINTNGSMRAGGTDWSVDDHGPLLLRDELHPSFAGLVAVASSVVEASATLLPEDSRAAFRASFDLDPMMVRRRLLDERAAELEAVRSRRTAAPQATPATP